MYNGSLFMNVLSGDKHVPECVYSFNRSLQVKIHILYEMSNMI